MFHSIGEFSWLHSPFRNLEIPTCGMYAHSTSIICAFPCQTSFIHTKSMLLEGDFFGFWISIYWDFEARPMFETMPWTNCIRINNKLIWWSKLYIYNMLNYMLIVIFNTNANVHVLSICFNLYPSSKPYTIMHIIP
jgi:hypothetical protein